MHFDLIRQENPQVGSLTVSQSLFLSFFSDQKTRTDQLTVMEKKPTAAAAPSASAPSLDPNGIQLGAWSHPIVPEEPEGCVSSFCARDVWFPCCPLAQVEARVGFATFGSALFSHLATKGGAYMAAAAALLYVAVDIYSYRVNDRSPTALDIVLPVVSFLLAASQYALFAARLARVRGRVRERFDIPGSAREDRTAAWQEPGRAIRQMRRHLQIESAPCCGAVETLPAYVV